ncbi:MAG: CvpA family protein [Steroidobacterales bacterium]
MNWLDYLIIILMAFSCAAGFMRGLLREVIALVTWVAAVWLAWSFAGVLEPYLGGALASEAVRPWAARVLIFLAVLLIGTLIGAVVTHLVRLSLFSGIDRFLGGVFGVLRGAAMLGVFVILCHALRLDGEGWWRKSILVPYAEHAGNLLRGLVGERKISAGRSLSASL